MTTGDAFRAFFAAPLPETAAGRLAEEARSIPAPWRRIPAERLHVTLRFLGPTSRARVADLAAALRDAAEGEGPAAVTLGPAAPFGGVLARPVSDPAGTLRRLAARLDERAAALGLPGAGGRGEPRAFRPHVTVARPASPAGPGRRIAGKATGRPPAASMGAAADTAETRCILDRVVLMESVPPPRGPAYVVVAEAILRGPASGGGAATGRGGSGATATKAGNQTRRSR